MSVGVRLPDRKAGPHARAEGVVRQSAENPGPGSPGPGVVVRGKFRPARGLVAKARPEPGAPKKRPVRRTNSARLARQLALAHWIERAVESGQVASYGEVARALGLTESRITQVTALLGLPPEVQERVLLGEGGLGIRKAINAARDAAWERQQPGRG